MSLTASTGDSSINHVYAENVALWESSGSREARQLCIASSSARKTSTHCQRALHVSCGHHSLLPEPWNVRHGVLLLAGWGDEIGVEILQQAVSGLH